MRKINVVNLRAGLTETVMAMHWRWAICSLLLAFNSAADVSHLGSIEGKGIAYHVSQNDLNDGGAYCCDEPPFELMMESSHSTLTKVLGADRAREWELRKFAYSQLVDQFWYWSVEYRDPTEPQGITIPITREGRVLADVHFAGADDLEDLPEFAFGIQTTLDGEPLTFVLADENLSETMERFVVSCPRMEEVVAAAYDELKKLLSKESVAMLDLSGISHVRYPGKGGWYWTVTYIHKRDMDGIIAIPLNCSAEVIGIREVWEADEDTE